MPTAMRRASAGVVNLRLSNRPCQLNSSERKNRDGRNFPVAAVAVTPVVISFAYGNSGHVVVVVLVDVISAPAPSGHRKRSAMPMIWRSIIRVSVAVTAPSPFTSQMQILHSSSSTAVRRAKSASVVSITSSAFA
jgi:hypothetical protein